MFISLYLHTQRVARLVEICSFPSVSGLSKRFSRTSLTYLLFSSQIDKHAVKKVQTKPMSLVASLLPKVSRKGRLLGKYS